MKIMWEAKNVVCGTTVAIPGSEERFLLGYTPRETKNDQLLINLRYGVTIRFNSKEEVADHLTNHGFWPTKLLDATIQARLTEYTV